MATVHNEYFLIKHIALNIMEQSLQLLINRMNLLIIVTLKEKKPQGFYQGCTSPPSGKSAIS